MQYSHFLPAKYITHTHTLSSLDGSVPMYTQEVTNTKFQHLNELRNTTKASVRDIAIDIINKIGLETVILWNELSILHIILTIMHYIC